MAGVADGLGVCAGPGRGEESGLLLVAEVRSGPVPEPVPVEAEGVVVGALVDGDAVLGGDDWPEF